MAQRVTVSLVDDIDGTDAAETVKFGLDGVRYEIDLNDKNSTKLRKVLEPYVGSARRVAGSAPKRKSNTAPKPSEVREWAKENGYDVPDRGRIPAEVTREYVAAH